MNQMTHQQVLAANNIPAGALLDPGMADLLAASLPTANDLHVTQLLTGISTAYRNDGHIWRDVLPPVPVARKKDSIRNFNQSDWLKVEARQRSQNVRGARGGYRVGTDTYTCIEYSMSTDVTDDERDMANIADDPDVDATVFCSDQVNARMEKLASAVVFGSGNYASGNTSTLAGANQWSDGASDPIGNCRDAKETVSSKIGRDPNTLVIGAAVWRQLQDHPDIVDRFVNTQTGIITPAMVAQLFELDRILVGKAIEVTTLEQATTVTTARIWGKQAAFLYLPTGPSLRTPAYGYTLIHGGTDFLTETWRNGDGATSDAVRVRTAAVHKVLATQAGYLYSDAVA
jgi:hypothetical protein